MRSDDRFLWLPTTSVLPRHSPVRAVSSPLQKAGKRPWRHQRSISLFERSSEELPTGSSKILFYFEILNNTKCKKDFIRGESPRFPKETSERDQCAGDCSRNPPSISIYTLREALLYRKAYNLSMRLVGLCGSMRDGTNGIAWCLKRKDRA